MVLKGPLMAHSMAEDAILIGVHACVLALQCMLSWLRALVRGPIRFAWSDGRLGGGGGLANRVVCKAVVLDAQADASDVLAPALALQCCDALVRASG